jgi:radical SAM superfamily enzyme YgiQ (UPF0313 family)
VFVVEKVWQRDGLTYRCDGQTRANLPRDLVHSLDSLPFPLRDASSLHLGDRHFFVLTTRGCPYTCTFCSIPSFYKTPKGSAWRARSVDNVLAELHYLVTSWRAEAISFLDDEFLVGPNGKSRAPSG